MHCGIVVSRDPELLHLILQLKCMHRPSHLTSSLIPSFLPAADDPNLLRNRPIGDRTAVITAGVLANMVLAFAICVTQVRRTRRACCI